VSANIIDASWHALVDSVEYKLYQTRGDARPEKKPRSTTRVSGRL